MQIQREHASLMWPTFPNSVQPRSEWQGQLSSAGISQEPLMFPGYGNPHDRPMVALQEVRCDVVPLVLTSAYIGHQTQPFGGRGEPKKEESR